MKFFFFAIKVFERAQLDYLTVNCKHRYHCV